MCIRDSARLDRKIDATSAERRRLVDLYQAGLIDLPELQRRSGEVAARNDDLQTKRTSLAAERTALAHGNLLRRRVKDFARQVAVVIDQLDNTQREHLLRLLIDDVHVTGWHVQIHLRIPLDAPDADHTRPGPNRPTPPPAGPRRVSSQDRLRSVGVHQRGLLPVTRPPCPHPDPGGGGGPPWLKPRGATTARRQPRQRNQASSISCSVRSAGPRSPGSAASATAPRRAARPRGPAATPWRWKSPNPLSRMGSGDVTSRSTSVQPATPATTASNGATTATSPAPASASAACAPTATSPSRYPTSSTLSQPATSANLQHRQGGDFR